MSLPNVIQEDLAHPSEFIFPESVMEAVNILASWAGAARIIAGGTDLMLDIEKKKAQPRCLVSLGRIPGLDSITIYDEYIEIGAAVTFSTIINHSYINQKIQVLADAARSVGSLAIQNVATLSGNIVNAMPAADGSIAVIALEGEACIVDIDSTTWRPVESLFIGPGSSIIDPTRQLLTHIRIPRFDHHRGTAWHRLGRRPSLTLPILNCAVNIHLDKSGQKISRARIALGPVAPRPFRALQAENFLEGRTASADILSRAAQIVQEETNPRGNVLRASRDYRKTMIPVIVEHALHCAVQRALASAAIG